MVVVVVRLARGYASGRVVWVVPAVAGMVVTGYLAWGAWVSAHDPGWLYRSQVWWRVCLQPGNNQAILAMATLWLAALLLFGWPRRHHPQVLGLTAVVAMVVIGGFLGIASLAPCRGAESGTAVVAWVLGLFVGNPPSVYPSSSCPGQPPLALQAGQAFCLGAILLGALAAAVLWRQPFDRLRARLVRDATIFTGLDAMTIPLLWRLAETSRPASIVVIEPDSGHPLLDEARATGAHVVIGDPASPRMLLPLLASNRGCTLSQFYALRSDAAENEAILAAAKAVLSRYRPDPDKLPRLTARIDDPRRADHWRGWHMGASTGWFEEALSPYESTSCALADQIFRTNTQTLLLCGDSTLALAILQELARRAWERQGLASAAAAGWAAHRDGRAVNGAQVAQVLPLFPLERVILLDERAGDLRREYLATVPSAIAMTMPEVSVQPGPWKDHLLAALDDMASAAPPGAVVVIADAPDEGSTHEAGRAARLHPGTQVFVLASDGAGASGAVFDLLLPFQRAFLVGGEAPEDAWTRITRHWHECFRLSHPAVPGQPTTLTGRPWADLDRFIPEPVNLNEARLAGFY